jgi:hypothetical protein
MKRKEAQAVVAKTAMRNAIKNGRTEPNMLDAVPICITPEYLQTLRKAFGIKVAGKEKS